MACNNIESKFGNAVIVVLMGVYFTKGLYAQPGFISIDCGSQYDYVGLESNISYVPDTGFISTGSNSENLAPPQDLMFTYTSSLQTLRYFPNQSPKKNCYVLPVKPGGRYIVRAFFYQGGYVGGTLPVSFNISIDTFEYNVLINDNRTTTWLEVIGEATLAATLSVCLIRITPADTPFISTLEFRPLQDTMYLPVSQGRQLQKITSYHFRPVTFNTLKGGLIRYPDDIYDRFWLPYNVTVPGETVITTTNDVNSSPTFAQNLPPSKVLQTARTCPSNQTMSICFSFTVSRGPYYLALYFAEVQPLAGTDLRIFDISLDGIKFEPNFNPSGFTNRSLYSAYELNDSLYNSSRLSICWSFQSTNVSTLGPLLNAAELFQETAAVSISNTNNTDASIIEDIKRSFHLTDWTGDPCVPVAYQWLTCTTDAAPKILTLTLSNYLSRGSIPPSISGLSSLTTLLLGGNALTGVIPDLSELINLLKLHLENNSLTGSIPESLGKISTLQELFLENNNLSGSIPTALTRNQNLKFRYDGNPGLCIVPNQSCIASNAPAVVSPSSSPLAGNSRLSLRAKLGIGIGTGFGIPLVIVFLAAVVIYCNPRLREKAVKFCTRLRCKGRCPQPLPRPDEDGHQTVHQLYPSGKPDPEYAPVLDIVFFHGLQITDGRDAWRTTWENGRGECWPRDWLPDDLQKVLKPPARFRVLSVSYNAQATAWLAGGFGQMEDSGFDTITDQFIQSLVVARKLGAVPFVLVGHSYGGLVIKSLVAQCHSKAIRTSIMQNPNVDATLTAAKEFMKNLKGIEFYAVPQRGTNMANFAMWASKCLKVLRIANFVSTDLTMLSRATSRLYNDFDQAIHGRRVAIFSIMEGKGIRGMGKVVMETSAEYQGNEASVRLEQTDHFSVCKPENRQSESYCYFLGHLMATCDRLELLGPNHGPLVPTNGTSTSGS